MMYMHYCKNCNRIHMLNGHKMFCPKCHDSLKELKISYLEYAEYSKSERMALLSQCQNEKSLNSLSTTYRMYKYSKQYRKIQQEQNCILYPSVGAGKVYFGA